MTILPFLGSSRKKRQMMAQEVKEFSELVKDQYTFLMQQLEKVLKDYFDLSSKVKEMHAEIFSLRGQLTQADGDIKTTREIERIGAHAKGHNQNSIGICYEGGLDCHGHPADTRTEWQVHSMHVLILTLLRDYPGCRVCGHRDLSPDLNGNGEIEPEEWIKACPCFEVKAEWDG